MSEPKGTPESPWLVPVPSGDRVIEAVAAAQEPNVTTEFLDGETHIRVKCGVCIRVTRQSDKG